MNTNPEKKNIYRSKSCYLPFFEGLYITFLWTAYLLKVTKFQMHTLKCGALVAQRVLAVFTFQSKSK